MNDIHAARVSSKVSLWRAWVHGLRWQMGMFGRACGRAILCLKKNDKTLPVFRVFANARHLARKCAKNGRFLQVIDR
ncbi:hypothetical protein HMPREF1640_01800 [Prevotella sp. S7-1-8]|nr:hypothetical protein HMPREF1640_01800 [Prevotella sp. S7-1-8]